MLDYLRWALSAISNILIKEKKRKTHSEDTERRGQCKKRSRLEGYVTISPGMLNATSSWKRKGTNSLLELLQKVQHCWQLDFGLRVFRRVREYVSVVLSPTITGFIGFLKFMAPWIWLRFTARIGKCYKDREIAEFNQVSVIPSCWNLGLQIPIWLSSSLWQ